MIGGGFIGQMHETMKKNREMLRAALGKTKRKNFDNGEYKPSGNRIPPDKKKLSEKDREILITRVRLINRNELIRRIIIIVISLLIVSFLVWALPILFNYMYN